MSSVNVEIRVLGELSVRVGAEERALPRSRKTRALLGYLALTGRAHRREQLCDLFWDVTDDPRAALRWSLSKLRKVLDVADGSCLVATRTHVQVQLAAGQLDIDALRAASKKGLEAAPLEQLEALASACEGELLEGLLLPDFDAFEGWLEAERADARALHARLRSALTARLASDPERALPHARAWLARSGAEEAQRWVARLSADAESRASRAPSVALSPHPSPERREPPAAPAPLHPLRPLVGRDRELSRLRVMVESMRSQPGGRIVLVLGEPGMGKTRLLEELRSRLAVYAPYVLDVTFYEGERHRPFAPFLDAARDALPHGLPAVVQGAHGELGALDREQLFEALSALIRRGASERGLGLLLLDDAHLADASSCELLHHVVRTATRVPLLTVLCARPAELEDNAELTRTLGALRRRELVEELPLHRLDDASLTELVRTEAPHARLEALLRESAGNPFIALCLARASESTGQLPRTLSDLVLARVASLPEPCAALVRWAAVFERGPLALLEAASGEPNAVFVDALTTATRYGLVRIEPPGTFAMAHALLGRVVYDAIHPVRRAALHRRVAEVLRESERDADRSSLIAHHATRADRPDLAARALLEGAARSARVGGRLEAAELAERALALVAELTPSDALGVELEARVISCRVRRPDEPARFVARLTELGLAALGEGRRDEAHRAFHAAAALRWDEGEGDQGYTLARQAWHASRGGTGLGQARASSLMALCLALMEKQLPDAQAILLEAEALAHADRNVTEPVELPLARACLHLHAGRLAEARHDAADARLLARASQHALNEAAALQLSLQVELYARQHGAARAAAEALGELSTRIREGGEAGLARAALALVEPDLGSVRPVLRAALEQLQTLDDKRRLCWVANRWARREREALAFDAALGLARQALAAAQAVEAPSEAAIALAEVMALAAHAQDDPAYAEAEAGLAELEAQSALSDEARRWVAEVTQVAAPVVTDPQP